MTPSENDLRAALRHGEADSAAGPDVDRIVDAGRDRAAQRRVRLLSGAAVVAVVAAAAIGSALLASGDGSGPDAANQRFNGPALHGSSAVGQGAAGARSGDTTLPAGPAGPVSPAHCPAALPNPADGNGIGVPAGAPDKLFARPVEKLIVCSYGEGESAGYPSSVVLRGSQADQLRVSLETAAQIRPAINCPMIILADERSLAIYGVTSAGDRLGPVVTKINAVPCRVTVTNGRITRYDWSPPAAVKALLAGVTPGPSLAPGVPGASSGSRGAGATAAPSGQTVTGLPTGTAVPASPTKHGSPIHN